MTVTYTFFDNDRKSVTRVDSEGAYVRSIPWNPVTNKPLNEDTIAHELWVADGSPAPQPAVNPPPPTPHFNPIPISPDEKL